MARFTAPQAQNCSPNAAHWEVVGLAKRRLRAAIVCLLDSSFTRLGLAGVAGNMTKRGHWQIVTAIRCRLRWKIRSERSRFRQSVAALTVIPIEEAAHIAFKTTGEFLAVSDEIQKVIFVVWGEDVYDVYRQNL